jgi:hypothetical protein
MKPALFILPIALGLSGCANAIKTAEYHDCQPGEFQHVLVGSFSNGGIVGRNLSGIGRFDTDRPSTWACVPQVVYKPKAPQTYDLHKVGHVRPIPPATQSAIIDSKTL